MAHDVFLSYSSKDKPIADAVCGTLEGKRIRCWIAPRDVLPGLPYGEAIVEAIEASRVMVLVFSASANKSPQVMREVERAVSKGIPIIPFRIEEVPPSKSLEHFISSLHWLNALTPPLEKHLQFLAETVQLLLVRHGKRCDPLEGEYEPGLGTVEEIAETRDHPPIQPSSRGQERSSPSSSKGRRGCQLQISIALGLLVTIGVATSFVGFWAAPRTGSHLPTTDAGLDPITANSIDNKPTPTITNSIGMKLVFVKPGVFLMGSPSTEEDRNDDEHQHEVEITRPFYVGVHEVTQEQYECVMLKNPSWFSPIGGGQNQVKGMDTRQFPVDSVSWEDAVKFCRRLSELPEEKMNERTYRLPTEAEWEYICRGGPFFKKPSPPFYFGNSLSPTQANFDGNYPYGGAAKDVYLERPTKVGSYPANPLGLYDLHGNVWEWCADWYDAKYYNRSPRQDPQGPENGERRVMRGGSWYNHGRDCRAAYRISLAPGGHGNFYGFRVVLFVGART
jgi:formylglycine-generating enzyme required for sulfatase activity